jgi:hypothetical protein
MFESVWTKDGIRIFGANRGSISPSEAQRCSRTIESRELICWESNISNSARSTSKLSQSMTLGISCSLKMSGKVRQWISPGWGGEAQRANLSAFAAEWYACCKPNKKHKKHPLWGWLVNNSSGWIWDGFLLGLPHYQLFCNSLKDDAGASKTTRFRKQVSGG